MVPGWFLVGFWLVSGWFVGSWLVSGWFMVDSWLVSGWFLVGLARSWWVSWVCGWFLVGFWLVSGWFLVGFWLVPGWFLVGSWLVSGWFLVGLARFLCLLFASLFLLSPPPQNIISIRPPKPSRKLASDNLFGAFRIPPCGVPFWWFFVAPPFAGWFLVGS